MKTAAKVFIIIGIVLTFWLIYPLVLGFIALNKIDEARDKSELQTWGIITLILVSQLGGLFMLLIPNEELSQNYVETNEEVKTTPVYEYNNEQVNTNSFEYIEKIKELKDLFDSGAITEEEFIHLKAKLLNK